MAEAVGAQSGSTFRRLVSPPTLVRRKPKVKHQVRAAAPPRSNPVVLDVHVQPRASRTEVAGYQGTALKIRIHAPPVEGAANAELVRFLARSLGVPRDAVHILTGMTSRRKRIEIVGASPTALAQLTRGGNG